MLLRRPTPPWLSSVCLLLTMYALGEEGSEASANTPMGAVISNPELAAVGGGKRTPQGPEAANVLVFFRPDKDASVATLKGLAPCEKRTAGKSVRWTGIVSDKYLSLIHISEPTRLGMISYAVFCLKKKK